MNETFQPLVDALVAAAVLVIPAAAAVLVVYLRSYLTVLAKKAQAELGAANYELLLKLGRNLVLAAEQTFILGNNSGKKQFVMKMLRDFASQHNIPISEDQLDALVEGVLSGLKVEQVTVTTTAEVTTGAT